MKLIGITIMVSLLMTSTIFSQNVAISDSNFYKALIIEGVDTNGDGQISYLEAEQKTQLNIREMGIINLNGIEAFINLDRLACSGNQLDSIDISNNHSLTYLDCSKNRLTELDISENQLLTSLFCTDNRLTTLDVSGSPGLVNLGIANNQITMLAVIESPVLEYLSCLSNQLTSLDVSNNSALVYLELGDMPTLHEVCVWTIPFPPAGLQVNTTDSPNLFFTKACYNQIVFIPDAALLNALIASGVDMDHDSLIGYTEAALTANLYVDRKGITDVTGIEAFVNLDSLACSGNQLSSIDVSHIVALTYFDCTDNQLAVLDVSKNPALLDLRCSNNQLTSLDVSNNPGLWHLYSDNNLLTSLDVSKNPALLDLSCSKNQLTSLDVSNNLELLNFWCDNNSLTSLDVSKNPALREIGCSGNQLSSLDLSTNSVLGTLWCNQNKLTSIDLKNNPLLGEFNCSDNQIRALEIPNNSILRNLECKNNQMTTLDLSSNFGLHLLNCSNNHLTSLDLSNNISLEFIELSDLPALYEVCVWTMPFPPADYLAIDTTGSPDVYFTTNCSRNTSVEDSPVNGLLIYPNPLFDLLTINTEYPGLYLIEIISSNGEIISGEVLEGTTQQIDLSSFQKGIYFITIRSKDFVTTRKIIKL